MPVTHDTTGTGITKKPRTSISAPMVGDEVIAVFKKWGSTDYTFEGLHGGPLEAHCRDILEKAGLAKPRASLTELASVRVGDKAPDSQEGYAVRFVQELRLIRTCIETERAADAARFAFYLGTLVEEARMKFAWERYALRGVNNDEHLSWGRDENNQKRRAVATRLHKRWCQRARELWPKHPTWSATTVAEKIAQEEERIALLEGEGRKTPKPDYIRHIIRTESPPQNKTK